MAKCASCGKHYSIWSAALGEGVCVDCSRAQKQARLQQEEEKAVRESGALSPEPPVPGLAVVFRILAALEFIGGFIWCYLLWPGEPAAGYEWKSVTYVTPLVFLMAGIIFGCLFLAVAEVLVYLRDIRDSLAQRT
jgi:hypothetical protein